VKIKGASSFLSLRLLNNEVESEPALV